MMESDLREAQTKRAMAETAAEKVAMIDHLKFGHVYVATSLLPEEMICWWPTTICRTNM